MNKLLDERLESWWLETLDLTCSSHHSPQVVDSETGDEVANDDGDQEHHEDHDDLDNHREDLSKTSGGHLVWVVMSSEQLYIFVDLPLGSRICDWRWSCLQSRIPRSSWSTLWESLSKGCQTLRRPWLAWRRGPCQKRWGSLCKPWRTWSAGRSPSYALNKQP